MGALEGRVAIITGAGRGIGREHALLFAAEGAKVVVNDLGGSADGSGGDVSAAQQVVEEIAAMGGEAVANGDSVSSWEGSQRLVNAAIEAFGDLDILVNNAGILVDDGSKGVSGQSLETWRTTFDTNVFGLIETTQAFLPLLRKSEAGRIVNVSSLLGSISEHQNPASFIYEFKGVPGPR